MALALYNSLTQKKQPFAPLDPEAVRIYSCGPTVYNYNHLGNFRAYVFVDLLRRYLKFRGYGLNHAMNITDVEDKIIEKAHESGKSIEDFTAPYIEAYLEDLSDLGIDSIEHRPRATEHIPAMIDLIEALKKSGHAYDSDGTMYFRIASFRDYGQLSRLDPTELKTAADGRFAADEYTKEDARDFALWKAPTADYERTWPANFGTGRPGWHTECSAMIREIFGEGGIDIHTGGIDLLFPHHENEIAQSACAYPEDRFVSLWLHNEHLLVEGKKMSKSLGNFFTLRELSRLELAEDVVKEKRAPEFLLELIHSGKIFRAIRYVLLTTHYRQKLNFTFEALRAAESAIDRMEKMVSRLLATTGADAKDLERDLYQEEERTGFRRGETGSSGSELADRARAAFVSVMDDDLNISRGLAVLFDLVRDTNLALESGSLSTDDAYQILLFFYHANNILNVIDFAPDNAATDKIDETLRAEVEALIKERNEARAGKDFARADQIRDDLQTRGILLKDGPEGTLWEVVHE